MEPNEISKLLSSGDPEQIKQGQKALQGLGYYDGAIDGQMGPNTIGAVKQYRTDSLAKSEAEATQSENDPVNQAVRFGTDVGPYAGGALLGWLGARGTRKFLDSADKRQGRMAEALAQDESLSPEAAKRGVSRMGRRRAIRNVGQFAAPATLFGTAALLRDWAERPETSEDLSETLNTVASAEQGAGTVMGALQLKDAPKRFGESPNSPVDIARIETRTEQARAPSRMAEALANNQARDITPPQTPTEGRTALPAPDSERAPSTKMRNSDRVYKAAQAARVPGRANMNTTQRIEAVRKRINDLSPTERADVAEALGESRKGPNLTKRITNALDRVSKPGVSAIAGAMAYDAIRGDAEARPVEAGSGQMAQSGPSMAEALAGATAAAGGTYASMKGTEKLGAMASRYAPGVARVAGRAFPPAAAALTAYDLYNLAQEHQPETEAGTGRVARREPTPRELNAKQLRQRHLQHRAMLRALKEQQR